MARLCFVSALLIQSILPSGQALAAPPLQSTPPLTADSPRVEPLSAQPPSEPMLPPVLPTEDIEPILPSIAANVLFDLAEPVVVAGEKVLLTITVRGEFETPIKELLLTLRLPTGVTADGAKGELRWPLPAQLTDRPFVQAVTLQVDSANLTTTSAVLPFVATLTAPGYRPRACASMRAQPVSQNSVTSMTMPTTTMTVRQRQVS